MTSTQPHDQLGRLAGGVLIGSFDGPSLPDFLRERLAQGHLAGVTLFKRNLVSLSQCAELCEALTEASPALPPVLSIDQEGGRVARLHKPFLSLGPMKQLGRIDDPELTNRVAQTLAQHLRAVGLNLNFSPVADVDSNPANPVIGDRAFGPSTELVSRHVTAFVKGLQSQQILACAKHFPGHGDTAQDSHVELPHVHADRQRLDALDLPPFRAAIAADVATIMTAHVCYDGLCPTLPATLDPVAVHELLRKELHFQGVCLSDDLHMDAVRAHWPVEEAAIRAISAGCDGLLLCQDPASQERCRLALAARAQEDPGFAVRLTEAHGRMEKLRQKLPTKRSVQNVEDYFSRGEHLALEEEIRTRLAAV